MDKAPTEDDDETKKICHQYHQSALVNKALEKWDEAINDCNLALQLDPMHYDACYTKVRSHFNLRQYRESFNAVILGGLSEEKLNITTSQKEIDFREVVMKRLKAELTDDHIRQLPHKLPPAYIITDYFRCKLFVFSFCIIATDINGNIFHLFIQSFCKECRNLERMLLDRRLACWSPSSRYTMNSFGY